jgi:hypothetical protein
MGRLCGGSRKRERQSEGMFLLSGPHRKPQSKAIALAVVVGAIQESTVCVLCIWENDPAIVRELSLWSSNFQKSGVCKRRLPCSGAITLVERR